MGFTPIKAAKPAIKNVKSTEHIALYHTLVFIDLVSCFVWIAPRSQYDKKRNTARPDKNIKANKPSSMLSISRTRHAITNISAGSDKEASVEIIICFLVVEVLINYFSAALENLSQSIVKQIEIDPSQRKSILNRQ